MHLNNRRPIGTSIPATEHSVMTAYPNERMAIQRLISQFGEGVFACVMDSYDYAHALNDILPSLASEKVGKGGYMVLRPDSGDPVETVLMALRAADKVFGHQVNKKGYKVIQGAGVIQGDGITLVTLERIAEAVEQAGYSAQNVAYGMGGGLLQRVHRDLMSFATKLCHITYADGVVRDVMKTPTQDNSKISLPGELAVWLDDSGYPNVRPKQEGDQGNPDNQLKVVYDHGPVGEWDDFDTVRSRVRDQWTKYALNKTPSVLSDQLQAKIKNVTRSLHEK
jgi:nicotinamide phosphoribosyltransferase